MANSLQDGLAEQMEQFLREHPDTNLIVIDTLQTVRGESNNSNPYANDYRELTVLRDIAYKHKIAILCVHHLRKMKDVDPMNMVFGTTGLSGVVDTVFILDREQRAESRATLFCNGRDIESQKLGLELDSTTHIWKLVSDGVAEEVMLIDHVIQRPGFQRMLEDIEKGVINCVITKDLSRLGRDYIMAGYYTEVYFPEKNVRYITINDGFDTLKGNSSGNDIAPFKNLLNDLYAKDISKKVRSSLQSKALNGEHGAAYAPIGYKKDPDIKNHLIIDEETVWVVKLIFEMCCNGKGCRQIRNYLQQNRILSPSALLHVRRQRYYGKQNFDTDEEALYRWSVIWCFGC